MGVPPVGGGERGIRLDKGRRVMIPSGIGMLIMRPRQKMRTGRRKFR